MKVSSQGTINRFATIVPTCTDSLINSRLSCFTWQLGRRKSPMQAACHASRHETQLVLSQSEDIYQQRLRTNVATSSSPLQVKTAAAILAAGAGAESFGCQKGSRARTKETPRSHPPFGSTTNEPLKETAGPLSPAIFTVTSSLAWPLSSSISTKCCRASAASGWQRA